jgi:membrane protein DedA with SNARE-associated domain
MTSYFTPIIDFIAVHPHYAVAAVFILALSEAVPLVGIVVPGSTLIIAISALAAGAEINPWLLLAAAVPGAIIGDGFSFWVGQRYHREILLAWPLRRYPQFVDRSEAFILRYGGGSVFLARFTAVVRAFVPLVAGVLQMSPKQFYVANVLSALAWAPAHVFPGVLLAFAVKLAGASGGRLAIFLIALAIGLSVSVVMLHGYLNRHPLNARLPVIPLRIRGQTAKSAPVFEPRDGGL